MIRIYVLIRRNGCTLIVPVRSTRIISCIFDAFRSCSSHSLCRANYKPLRFRVFLLLPPCYFSLSSRMILRRTDVTSAIVGGYFSFRAIPRSNQLFAAPGALKSITYPGFYPPDRSRVRSITYS